MYQIWRQRTNKGRVVYDRPLHPFRWSDCKRITDNLFNYTLADPYQIAEDFKQLKQVDACVATAKNGLMVLVDIMQFGSNAQRLQVLKSWVIYGIQEIVPLLLDGLRAWRKSQADPGDFNDWIREIQYLLPDPNPDPDQIVSI